MSSKRRYSTSLRAQQTELSRERILDSARELFLERGYLGTTLSAIAATAGVSVQTIYNVAGNKPALFKTVYDTTLAGDDEPTPMADRPMYQAMRDATDAQSCLAQYAAIARTISERVLPLVAVALANSGDPELHEFIETTENERAFGARHLADHVDRTFGLRPGLDVADAADTVWALTAPELADRLVNRRGWPWDKYQEWLYRTVADSLLGSGESGIPHIGRVE